MSSPRRPSRRRHLRTIGIVGALGSVVAVALSAQAATPGAPISARTTSMRDALSQTDQIVAPWVDPASVSRAKIPTDTYALAGGCYSIRALDSGKYLTLSNKSVTTTSNAKAAEPFRMQAYDLGRYLIYDTNHHFLSTPVNQIQVTDHAVLEIARGALRGTLDESINGVRAPILDITKLAEDTVNVLGNVKHQNVVINETPSEASEWIVTKLPHGFQIGAQVDDGDEGDPGPTNAAISGAMRVLGTGALQVDSDNVTSASSRFVFELAKGCATYPEITTNVSGKQPTRPTSYQEAEGYVDAHMHGMAFEFLGGAAHCGRPWHPYGVTSALVDCPDHAAGGRGAVLEAFLSGGTPGVDGHDTVGWPSFNYWPKYNSLTHEGTYYAWIERAWRGGLRMYTNLFVDNGALCEIYPIKRRTCNEMDTVRVENLRLNQMIRYIDAQNGGPGKGWLQVALDPFQGRAIANAGKLAVVKGIEVSVPFDCGEYLNVPRCTAAQIDKGLDEVYAMGVRQMEITNKFDNALTGVTGDSGATGVLVQAGNRYKTGHYWQMEGCPKGYGAGTGREDHRQLNAGDDAGVPNTERDSIFGGVLAVFGGMGAAPVYAKGPHCNILGLSNLGKHVIDGLIARGMIFDPDHMSALGRKEAMEYVNNHAYAGVVSSHSWADDPTYKSVIDQGGFVTPYAGGSVGFVNNWRKLRKWAPKDFPFAIGYGSDINGFGAQGGPRNAAANNAVKYPFTGLGGVRVDKQTSGTRTYNINSDGTDHYGLYADWIEDVRLAAGSDGPAIMADLKRGLEGFLQTWERGIGVRGDSCRADIADINGVTAKQVKKGMTTTQAIAILGQPHRRAAGSLTYCATNNRSLIVKVGQDETVSSVSI